MAISSVPETRTSIQLSRKISQCGHIRKVSYADAVHMIRKVVRMKGPMRLKCVVADLSRYMGVNLDACRIKDMLKSECVERIMLDEDGVCHVEDWVEVW